MTQQQLTLLPPPAEDYDDWTPDSEWAHQSDAHAWRDTVADIGGVFTVPPTSAEDTAPYIAAPMPPDPTPEYWEAPRRMYGTPAMAAELSEALAACERWKAEAHSWRATWFGTVGFVMVVLLVVGALLGVL